MLVLILLGREMSKDVACLSTIFSGDARIKFNIEEVLDVDRDPTAELIVMEALLAIVGTLLE